MLELLFCARPLHRPIQLLTWPCFDRLRSRQETTTASHVSARRLASSLLVLAFPVATTSAQAATFTTFDAQNARETVPLSINGEGTVAGYYSTRVHGEDRHGFVRTTDGTITEFDPKGSSDTNPSSINSLGTIAGYYDIGAEGHGFVRAVDGTIASFDPPASTDTTVTCINDSGTIVGYYYDAGFHGY